MKNARRPLQNQSGIITIDFIFAFVLVWGFFSIFFALSLTLTVVEVTQYITFSTARTFHAGHWDVGQQVALGEEKFQTLRSHPTIAPLFSNGWFELGTSSGLAESVGNQWNRLYPQPTSGEEGDSSNFIGSRVSLNAKILHYRIPLVGSTTDDEDAFQANVGSYLNREPSSVECLNFMSAGNRFNAIKQLDPSYNRPEIKNYALLADNGC